MGSDSEPNMALGNMIHQVYDGAYRIVSGTRSVISNPRVLLVGEDNPQSADPRFALWPIPAKGHPSCAGKNLQSKVLVVPHAVYYSLWRTNLCSPTWNLEAARGRAALLTAWGAPWKTIVALGRRVAGAFEHAIGAPVPLFGYELIWQEFDDTWTTVAGLPHPSGLSRAWNDPRSYDRTLTLMREVAPEVAWGSWGTIPQGTDHG